MKKFLFTLLGVLIALPCTFQSFASDNKGQALKYASSEADHITLEDGTILGDNGKTLLYAAVKGDGTYIIPDGVERITKDAFQSYERVEVLTIPASVNYVEADAFLSYFWDEYGIERLTSKVGRTNFIDFKQWYENVTLENLAANPYNNGEAYAGGVKVSTPELKEGMTEIRDYVNVGLGQYRDEIELPSTLKRIGAYAFYENTALYSVTMHEGLEEIGEYAFALCVLLENVKLPSTLNKIEDYAFNNCTTLTEVELPEGLKSLGKGVYKWCSSIEKAILTCNIDTIADESFSWCGSLNKIYFPLNLKRIGNQAFFCCTAIDEIKLPNTLEAIGEEAFSFGRNSVLIGKLTKLVIPNSVTELGKYAFAQQQITDLAIGSGLETIPEGAFYSNRLRSIRFSEGLKTIKTEAFSYNSEPSYTLTSVKFPSSLIEIEPSAFAATSISDLEIPDGIVSLPVASCGVPSILTIGSGIKEIAAGAFSFDNLKVLRLKANTPPTLSSAFFLTDDQNDALTLIVNEGRKDRYTTNALWRQIDNIVEEGATEVVIYMTGDYSLSEEIRTTTGLYPSQVTKMKVIGPLTDTDLRVIKENMVSLQGLDLSEVTNLTEIPEGQFSNSLLSEIILPNNTVKIGDNAFANCQLLKLSELPETIESIGYNAFYNCPGITLEHLPEALEGIGSGAFSLCSGIRQMKTGQNLTSIGASVFSECKLLEKVDLGASPINSINDYMFSGCNELDKIILPESVIIIGPFSFSDTAIRDISFVSGVTSISYGAFSNCRRLVAATIPEGEVMVDQGLFENCPRLIAVSMPKTTTYVAQNILNGDKKLANISCAAVDAPEAETGAFDNVRVRYISLTVPMQSFRSYLNAPQWGKFQSIQNRIPVTIDPEVDVTNVAEDEYQDMLKEDQLEEDQEEAAKENGDEPTEVVRRRMARRAEARTKTDRSFASLFDGAQICNGSEGSGIRIFINPKEGVNVTSVTYGGKEMISQMEGNSLLLPANTNGALVIRTDSMGDPTGIDFAEFDYEEAYEVYNLNGLKVADSLDSLEPGIYVLRQGGKTKKVAVK